MTELPLINSKDCSHFEKCNAAVCPVDPRWRQAVHQDGERVCFYLRCAVKEGAEKFANAPVFHRCRAMLAEVMASNTSIGRQLKAAARCPIKVLPKTCRGKRKKAGYTDGSGVPTDEESSVGS